MLGCERRDFPQLGLAQHAAGRVVGRIDQNGFGPRRHCPFRGRQIIGVLTIRL